MFRLIYSLLLYLLLLPLLLYLLWRSRKDPAYRQRLTERFSWQLAALKLKPHGIVVHAVSVGEVIAATPLIRQLQQRYPTQPITVTCTTPTGSATIVERFGDSVQHCYLPFDYVGAVGRFLRCVQPRLVVIVETELWPNLLAGCRHANIPVVVVNARLSAKSAKGYRRFHKVSQSLLADIRLLLCQNRATAARFRALGYRNELQVAGNLKFELALPTTQQALVERFAPVLANRLVWVAGSTHAGEDEQLLALYPALKQQFPNLLLMLVPRHLERFDKVADLVTGAGLSLWRRSSDRLPEANVEVALGDSMGELLSWYQLADLVFIGGSLIPRGGHNPLEAISFAKAVQSGPHVFNFKEAYRQLQQRSAVSIVSDATALLADSQRLLADSALRQTQGQRAQVFFLQQQGATSRTLQAIAQLIGASMPHHVHQQGHETFWFDPEFFSTLSAAQFDSQWWQQQNAVIGSSSGRNIAYFVKHQQHKLVLRHYYRGGLVGKLLHDQFWLQSVGNSRAMQEYQLLAWMREQGLAVPKPVAARYQRSGLIYRADLLIELIPDSKDLAAILQQRPLTPAEWQAVGKEIARMHQLGVYHSDLNCRNIMLDGSGTVWLIDFDKCQRRSIGPWTEQNLARLLRSFNKELAKLPVFHWQAAAWNDVMQGYQQQLNSKGQA
ncbi:lipid IV(A) 3-deoxy-D-manno-octulosonic acid transferase [Alishewanella sp. 16-MA]|uniref:3-deoxy-D-manno-octulosonic acid kinase n=1 Tax=Alishewanella maricola TaxID=2795740 RepID=A0ABS8C1S3_9ALTE|nr:lipid IV(A) 3-deoxy-D-manno-octulosonic acid transferase [Alishewanella maricola]MCB5226289.1 lipid IV(A) 3-deoxy-D-manno-octulosonic acid transferase [Alishewanella maricola]